MVEEIEVQVRQLPHAEGLELPAYATRFSAGMDLRAAVRDSVILEPAERAVIPVGLEIALPEGFEAQVRPRSGLAARHGLSVLNAPGTIDSDYRGEVMVILINHGSEPYVIERGDRIAQLVVGRHSRVHWRQASELENTQRGQGGFGHTGT